MRSAREVMAPFVISRLQPRHDDIRACPTSPVSERSRTGARRRVITPVLSGLAVGSRTCPITRARGR